MRTNDPMRKVIRYCKTSTNARKLSNSDLAQCLFSCALSVRGNAVSQDIIKEGARRLLAARSAIGEKIK